MTMQQFIREHRQDLDACIRQALRQPELRLNDRERRLWILNDEGLYAWARREGVRV